MTSSYWNLLSHDSQVYGPLGQKMPRPNLSELRHIFRNASILICGIDSDGTTIFANPHIEKITGYPITELLGKNWWRTLYPREEYSQVVHLFKEFKEGDIKDYLMTLTTKTGEKRHVSWDSMNLYDSKRRLTLIICGGHDMTDKMILEREAEQGKANLYSMLTALGAGLVLLDTDMRILWANKLYAEWFGDIEEIRGKYCFCLYPRKELGCEYCPALEMTMTKTPFERKAFTRDGREKVFRLIATPITDEHDEIINNLVLSIDMTEQKALEKRLLQTERLASIGEFATAMAHEIRNPLTPIGGFARYLKKKIPHDSLVQKSVDAIIREVNRLERMVDGIEDFARTAKTNYAKVELNDLVEKSLALLTSDIKANNITLETYLAEDLPQVPMASDLIGRVMVHLIRNSIQAMPEGGRLTVATSRKGQFAEIRVTDTGPGIEKNDVSQVFQAFFSKSGGLGLGLTISSRIIQDHGGRISVEKANGQGAVFVVELPFETGLGTRIHSRRVAKNENEL